MDELEQEVTCRQPCATNDKSGEKRVVPDQSQSLRKGSERDKIAISGVSWISKVSRPFDTGICARMS